MSDKPRDIESELRDLYVEYVVEKECPADMYSIIAKRIEGLERRIEMLREALEKVQNSNEGFYCYESVDIEGCGAMNVHEVNMIAIEALKADDEAAK